MVTVYFTVFKVPENEKIKEKLFRILDEISQRDSSFKWGLNKKRTHISIISRDEKQAYARGYWIKQRANLPEEYRRKLVYKVYKIEI